MLEIEESNITWFMSKSKPWSNALRSSTESLNIFCRESALTSSGRFARRSLRFAGIVTPSSSYSVYAPIKYLMKRSQCQGNAHCCANCVYQSSSSKFKASISNLEESICRFTSSLPHLNHKPLVIIKNSHWHEYTICCCIKIAVKSNLALNSVGVVITLEAFPISFQL